MSTLNIPALEPAEAAVDALLGIAQVVNELFGSAAAAAMVGVTEAEFEAWLVEDKSGPVRSGVALSTFVFHAEALWKYAWGGTWSGSPGELDDALTEALVIQPLLNMVGADGNGVIPIAAGEKIELMLNAATARRQLDLEQHGALTVTMLAALARVSEKTIRMAANPKNERPLRIYKRGPATRIDPTEAQEWLERRADFKPTQYFASGPQPLHIPNIVALGNFCRGWREELRWEPEKLGEQLGWSAEQVQAYRHIESNAVSADPIAFRPADLLEYGRFLRVSDPQAFAIQAYRAIAHAHADAMLAPLLAEQSE